MTSRCGKVGRMRSARRWMCLASLLLAAGCGDDAAAGGGETSAEIEDELVHAAPPQCEPGPEITLTVENCELVTDGVDGPTAARMWTLETEDGSTWTRIGLAPDGGFYLSAEERQSDEGFEVVVARLGPNLDFQWSRRLIHTVDHAEDEEIRVRLRDNAVDHRGVALATYLHYPKRYVNQELASWLTSVDEHGMCSGESVHALWGWSTTASFDESLSVIESHPLPAEYLSPGFRTDAFGRV